jgi:hypothetical protein
MATNFKLMFFYLFIFFIGLVLISSVYTAQKSLSVKCVSNSVNIGLNMIMSMGVILLVLPLIQWVCHGGCDVPQTDLSYRGILITIFLILVISTCVIFNGLSSNNCDDATTKNVSIGIFIASLFMMLFLLYSFSDSFRTTFG